MFICPEELFLYRKIIKSLNRGLFEHHRIEPSESLRRFLDLIR